MNSTTNRYAALLACLSAVGLSTNLAIAASVNDLLIILESDGRAYTAQQTLSTDGDLMVLPLPDTREQLQTVFSGPERLTFEQAHQQNPHQLSLWSGSVLTRYKHRYGQGLVKPDASRHLLTVSMEHAPVSVENYSAMQSSITWILPDNATIERYEALPYASMDKDRNAMLQNDRLPLAREGDDSEQTKNWTISGNMISYSQSSGIVPELSLTFILERAGTEQGLPCDAQVQDSELCSPDIDGDEIPDYRDVCLPGAEQPLSGNNAGEVDVKSDTSAITSHSLPTDPLGCQHQSVIVLQDVRFQSGQSYLDVTARDVLDRVALALQSMPDQLFKVASHTDNTGRVAHNQHLSENRAIAIRHYLMLRGVSPNQIQARGYGETSPQHDNTLASGRRANRRVELRRLP